MGARWYNPAAGQFTSRDTTQVNPDPDSAAANPFAYAGDSPLTETDPTGHLGMPVINTEDGAAGSVQYVAHAKVPPTLPLARAPAKASAGRKAAAKPATHKVADAAPKPTSTVGAAGHAICDGLGQCGSIQSFKPGGANFVPSIISQIQDIVSRISHKGPADSGSKRSAKTNDAAAGLGGIIQGLLSLQDADDNTLLSFIAKEAGLPSLGHVNEAGAFASVWDKVFGIAPGSLAAIDMNVTSAATQIAALIGSLFVPGADLGDVAALGRVGEELATSAAAAGRAAAAGTATADVGGQAIVSSGKWDYLFGRVVSDAHNTQRSAQNLAQLTRVGVLDNAAGRALLQGHFDEIVADDSNIVRQYTDKYGEFQVRSSLFAGPFGFIHFETTWQIVGDNYRLVTAIPHGG